MDEYQNPVDDSKQVPSPLLIQIFNSPSMQQNNLESVQYIKSDFHLKSNSDYFEMLLKNSNENSTFRGLKICEMTNARTTKVFIPDISPGLIETVIKAISVESTMFKIIQNFHKPSFLDTPDLFYRVFEFFQLKSKCMNDLDMKVRENITRLNHESVFKIGGRFEQFSIDAKKRFEEEDAKIKENEAAAIRVQFQQSNARCYRNAYCMKSSCFDDDQFSQSSDEVENNPSSSENEHEDPFIEVNDEDDWLDYENAEDDMDVAIDHENFDGNQSDSDHDELEVQEEEIDEFHEEEINESENTDIDEYASEFDDQEQSDDHAESDDQDMSDHLDEYDAEDESDAQDDSDAHDDSDAQEESDVFDESVDQFEIENDFEVHEEEVIEFHEEETDELPNTDIDDYVGESDDQEQSDDHAEYDDQNMSDHLEEFDDQIESDEYIDSDGEY